MTRPPIGADDAREGLAMVAGQNDDLAARLVTPWWYHPALGLLAAGLILCVGSGSVLLMMVGLAGFGLGVGLLVQAYRRLTGLWVSGFRRGRSGALAAGLGALVAAGIEVAVFGADGGDRYWVALLAAVVVVAGTIVIGRAFDAALRDELRSGG